MSGNFEQVLKNGNKSGNSILRLFSDSGIDVVGSGLDTGAIIREIYKDYYAKSTRQIYFSKN
jgi:hypothetical protein